MIYVRGQPGIIYQAKDVNQEKIFDALECFSVMRPHVLAKRERMLRYYGYHIKHSVSRK
jgi:hypothetical protein